MRKLSERITHFITEERSERYGLGLLAKDANLSEHADKAITSLGKNPEYRMREDTARNLWDYFVTKLPNEILNAATAFRMSSSNGFGANLINFLDLDYEQQLRYAKNLEGKYLLFVQPWLPSKYFEVGEFFILGFLEMYPDQQGLICTESITKFTKKDGFLSVGEFFGHGYFDGTKFVIVARNEFSQIAMFNFNDVQPELRRDEPTSEIYGNMYSNIGTAGNGEVFKICSVRVEDFSGFGEGEYSIDDINLTKYEKYIRKIL